MRTLKALHINRPIVFSLALLLAAVLLIAARQSACAQQFEGIYNVTGNEQGRGGYSGQVELRWMGSDYTFIRTVTYDTCAWQGYRVATAWEGVAQETAGTLTVTVSLRRMDFITQAGSVQRTAADAIPVAATGAFVQTDSATLTGAYFSTEFTITETMTYSSAPGSEPIFQTVRYMLPSHSRAPWWVRRLLFGLFNSYHALPFVAQYYPRPEFQAAIHYMVYDRTDFQFYRSNPNTLRVLNKIIDDVSLAETLCRNNAFRYSLNEKAQLYDENMQACHIEPGTGMFVAYDPSANPPYQPTCDCAEWTGSYIASQAFRYRATGEAQALANIIPSLKGLFALVDITGDPTTFARAIMNTRGSVSGNWRRGTGEFAQFDWLAGGNNDMLRGLSYGFLTAWEALPETPEYEYLREGIRHRSRGITRYCNVANDGGFNEMTWNWLTWYFTGEKEFRWRFQKLAGNPLRILWIALGDGDIQYQGISDWSGHHLCILSLISYNILAQKTGDWRYPCMRLGLRRAVLNIRRTRPALQTIAYFGLGNPRAGDVEYLKDAIWFLREIPYPKLRYTIDYSLNPGWCISPYPSLPWKLDWTTNPGRRQGLYGYPVFESPRGADEYIWKAAPFDERHGGGRTEQPGVDYLHAYWLGRCYGVISAKE